MIDLGDGEYLMGLALEQAEKAYRQDEVPVGAVMTDSRGKILARATICESKVAIPVAMRKFWLSWRRLSC